MINSMTAFASKDAKYPFGSLTWELRSVNQRYLELQFRLPDILHGVEFPARYRLKQLLSRGKVDCFLYYSPLDETLANFSINQPLLDSVLAAAETVSETLGQGATTLSVSDVLRWPGMLESPRQDDGEMQRAAMELLDVTLRELMDMRKREGGQLRGFIMQRIEQMKLQLEVIRQHMPVVQQQMLDRVRAKINSLNEDLGESRLEQALVQLVQKMDIAEELDRLDCHLGEVESVLFLSGSVGRRLDFLMQELNREVNTIASKSSDAMLTSVTVEMKVQVEQMREQIQNIE